MLRYSEKWTPEQQRESNRNSQRKKSAEIREELLTLFGRKCAICGYDADVRALQVDHIHGGGNAERRSFSSILAYYLHILKVGGTGYQLLCANCNWIKRLDAPNH